MILKLLITLIFAGAVVQKFTGKVAPDWERWGYSRRFMYATGIAELVALALFWSPGLELVGGHRSWSGAARRTGHPDPAPRRSVPSGPDHADAAPGSGAVVPLDGCLTWNDRERLTDAGLAPG